MIKKLSEKINITIVGAGHYGRELIAPIYKGNSRSNIRAVISSTTVEKTLVGTALEGVPLFSNAREWKKNIGEASYDVFDLAVHPQVLPRLVQNLVEIGAKNFIFPKSVAVKRADLDTLLKLEQQHVLDIAVASQWHYSKLTERMNILVQEISRRSILEKVCFNWSQSLDHYTPVSALLPHMIQVAYSAGLLSSSTTVTIRNHSDHHLDFVLSSGGKNIELFTDLRTIQKKRLVEVYIKGKQTPELVADFLAIFKDGKGIQYPSLLYKAKKEEIMENNLKVMTDNILQAFSKNSFKKDTTVLTLNRYLPVAKLLLQIGEAIS